MKLEIIKQTRLNGDMYYKIYKDGSYLSDSTIYINGNEDDALKEIHKKYNMIKSGITEKVEIIKSEIL